MQTLGMLVGGNSLRATNRLCQVSIHSVRKKFASFWWMLQKTLSPRTAAGRSDRVWTLEEIAAFG